MLCSALRETNQDRVVDELLTVGVADRTDLAAVPFEYLLTASVQVDDAEDVPPVHDTSQGL